MARRKPSRSRRIVKKILKRVDKIQPIGRWNMDAVSCDGGKRWVSAKTMVEYDLKPEGIAHG